MYQIIKRLGETEEGKKLNKEVNNRQDKNATKKICKK